MLHVTRSPRTKRRKRSGSAPAQPLNVVLELVRAEDAEDPYAFRFAEQTYLLRRGAGSFESAVFPWGQEILDDLAALARPRPDRAAMARLGDRIRAFLEGASWKIDEDKITRALEDKRPVRITIRSAAAELYALPWELVTLKATGQHLGELPDVLFRYEWPDTKTAGRQALDGTLSGTVSGSIAPFAPPPKEGGRLLFAWSAAGGAVPADAHLREIDGAARAGNLPFDAAGDVLPNASLRGLRRALEREPVAVLHLLCHGGNVPSATEAYGLVLDGDGGAPDVIDAATLRQVIAPHATELRLVVLAACHGGGAGALGNHLGSVAQALHQIGIPTVVASRYPLSVDGSIALTRTLYRRLLLDLESLESAFLDARARAGEEAGRSDWASLQLYARAADGGDHRPFVFRPYRGLLAFQPADQRFYFGREQDVQRLLARLEEGRRLLTVVGASGSGKSSLVLAGLIPALQKGSLTYRVAVLRPGAHPCRSLAAAIGRLAAELEAAGAPAARALSPGELEPMLVTNPAILVDAVEQALAGQPPEAHVLLVVDQFEEVFMPDTEPAEVRAFLDAILHASELAGGRVHAVLTLRADFLGHSLEHRALAERVRETMEIALPMSEPQLREAILRPAARVGLRFEDGLVDALIEALQEDEAAEDASLAAGNLPLLQFALDELWSQRRGALISWESWRAIGGVKGSVAKRADQVLAASAEGDEERLVRDVFSRLVQLGEGTADTRRYATREELEAIAPGRSGAVLDRWIRSRLLTADEHDVGVAHEALIREWRTLRHWINQSREALRARQELGQDARRWEAGGRGVEYLWRGGRLTRALELLDEHRLPLSKDEETFLFAAKDEEQKAREEEEAKRRQELDQARQLLSSKEREMKARRLASIRLGVGLSLFAVLIVVSIAWFAQRKDAEADKARADTAEANKKEAQARASFATAQADAEAKQKREARRVGAAGDVLERDPTLALLLLADLEAPEGDARWMEIASQALWRPLSRLVLRHDGPVNSALFSPDGARILTASSDKTVRIWSAGGSGEELRFDLGEEVRSAAWSHDGKRVVTITESGKAAVRAAEKGAAPTPIGGDGAAQLAAWSPDDSRLVVVLRGGTAWVWTVAGKPVPAFAIRHDDEITAAAWSAEGRRVVTASRDRTAKIWSEDDPGRPIVLKGHKGPVIAAAFSPLDGRRVLTASDDGSARIWSADGKGAPVSLDGPWGSVHAAAWSPEGAKVVTAWEDKKLRVFSSDGKGKPIELAGHGGVPRDVAWTHGGDRIVSVSDGTRPRLWALANPRISVLLEGHEQAVRRAAWSPDGKWVITASIDGTARVWPGATLGAAALVHRWESPVRRVAIDPAGKLALALLADGSARIWTVGADEIAMVLEADKPFTLAAFGQGNRVITASSDGKVRLWPDGGAGSPVVFAGHDKAVLDASLSEDGARLVTASADGTAKIWSADGKGAPVSLAHPAEVTSARVSPDGTRVLTACRDGSARIWASDGQGSPVVLRHPGPVSSAVWSPDGARVLTACGDHAARLWPADGQGEPRLFADEELTIVSAAYGPERRRVLATTSTNAVRLWPAEGGAGVPIVGTTAALRPGHDQVLTTPASTESVAQLWQATGATALALRGHEDAITDTAWSPDGRWALTGSKDRSARLWPLDPALLREAMHRATLGCLSVKERVVLLGEGEDEAKREAEARCAKGP